VRVLTHQALLHLGNPLFLAAFRWNSNSVLGFGQVKAIKRIKINHNMREKLSTHMGLPRILEWGIVSGYITHRVLTELFNQSLFKTVIIENKQLKVRIQIENSL